jgi:hypothetical protein
MNNFYKDSHILFKDVSRKIADKKISSDMDVIHNTLFFALGIEKLLKGLLLDINPILILENSDFKNAFSVYYKDKLIKANENTNDIQQDPNGDVIAFHNSIVRSSLISQTAFDFKNTLMKLKNARDIIVHHSFDNLDIKELKLLLNRDFYIILKSFSAELQWGELHCFNNLHSKLALISSELQDDISKQLKLKIEAILSAWNVSKGVVGTIEKCKKITVEMLQNEFAYPAECPCCKNQAVVLTKPIMDYNPFLKQEIQVGLDLIKLTCGFCKLEIIEYTELDFLKVKPDIEKKHEVLTEYTEEKKPA